MGSIFDISLLLSENQINNVGEKPTVISYTLTTLLIAMQRQQTKTNKACSVCVCVCVCVFFPFILDIKFVGRTSRGNTGGRSHRISYQPSFCGAYLDFSREKDSAIPFPRRP